MSDYDSDVEDCNYEHFQPHPDSQIHLAEYFEDILEIPKGTNSKFKSMQGLTYYINYPLIGLKSTL